MIVAKKGASRIGLGKLDWRIFIFMAEYAFGRMLGFGQHFMENVQRLASKHFRFAAVQQLHNCVKLRSVVTDTFKTASK